VSRLLPWIAVALAVAVMALLGRQSAGLTRELSTDEFASLALKVGFIVLVGGAVVALFRQKITEALASALLWIMFALALVLGYSYRFELSGVADRIMVELVPGRASSHGRTVEIARANTGDFRIGTEVNGARVAMVLDTGASSVVLTHDAAMAAGLPLEFVKYSVNVETANGHTLAAPVTLARIAVGAIVEHDVPALIAQPGQLRLSLLGMSFLNRLQSWEVRGSRVMMRGYP